MTRTINELKMMQSLPLEVKVAKTKLRIREWVETYGVNGVYVSFSGGKDSTVLLHIVREMYPEVEAVFVNTGLEYPEIQKFVKTFDNVTILRPEMSFTEVVAKYGYPIFGKEIAHKLYYARNGSAWAVKFVHDDTSRYSIKKYEPILHQPFKIASQCCDVMKKSPVKRYAKQTGKVAITGQTAEESSLRTQQWLKHGCNGFDLKRPISNPMSFWMEQDILHYIKEYMPPKSICSVYGDIVLKPCDKDISKDQINIIDCLGQYEETDKFVTTGCERTGCIFCAFGCHLEKEPSRFQSLKRTHPKQYQYCIGGGEFNEDGIWQPSKDGLGMGYVFDRINEIYGEGFIKYK